MAYRVGKSHARIHGIDLSDALKIVRGKRYPATENYLWCEYVNTRLEAYPLYLSTMMHETHHQLPQHTNKPSQSA